MRSTEILQKVCYFPLFLVVCEVILTEGAKLPTRAKDSVTLCAKYRNEPKSGWSNLPKTCQIYLQSLEGDPTTVVSITAGNSLVTENTKAPLNIGEKEVEIEVEVEREGNKVETEKEIDIEIESEVETEIEYKCEGSTCKKDGTSNRKEGGTNGNSSSSTFNQDLLRTIGLLGITIVVGVTIVVIAVLAICLLRKRSEPSQPEERRKDYSRNVIRDQHNGTDERPPVRNPPAYSSRGGRSHRPQYDEESTISSSSRGRHPYRGGPKSDTTGKDHTRNWVYDQSKGSAERPPISYVPSGSDSSHIDQTGRPQRPQHNDTSTTSGSARGRHPHRGVPKDNTPGYSLVDDSQYASIDEKVSERSSASGRGGHYYFKLESDKESYPTLSSDPSRWTSSSDCSSNPSDSSSRKKQRMPQSCSASNKSTSSPPSELSIQSQYDHLDHSGSHGRTSSKESTGTSLRYDVLSRKE